VIIRRIATNSYNVYGNMYLYVAALLQESTKTLIPHFISHIITKNKESITHPSKKSLSIY